MKITPRSSATAISTDFSVFTSLSKLVSVGVSQESERMSFATIKEAMREMKKRTCISSIQDCRTNRNKACLNMRWCGRTRTNQQVRPQLLWAIKGRLHHLQ
ncbi:unnamed protein product [Ixodes persulcatus]